LFFSICDFFDGFNLILGIFEKQFSSAYLPSTSPLLGKSAANGSTSRKGEASVPYIQLKKYKGRVSDRFVNSSLSVNPSQLLFCLSVFHAIVRDSGAAQIDPDRTI